MYHSYVNEIAEYQMLIIALNYLRPNNIKYMYIKSDKIRSSMLPFIWYAAHINRSIKESDFNQIVNHLSFGSKIVKSNDLLNTCIKHTSILQLNLAAAELMPLNLGLILGEPINANTMQKSNAMTFSQPKIHVLSVQNMKIKYNDKCRCF